MHSSKKRPQRQIVYIDGENFLHRVSEILKSKKLISSKLEITTFNFRGLFESVLDEKNLKIQYYGTRVKPISHSDKKFQQHVADIISSQRKLKRCLINQNIEFKTCGLLSARSNKRYKSQSKRVNYLQEKGVDVSLAVDLILDNMVSQSSGLVYLASSDTDLLPAVRALTSSGVQVVYVGFKKPNSAVVAAASRNITIGDEEILSNYDSLS